MSNELTLKGSYTGFNKFRLLKKYDIFYSTLLNKSYNINRLTIKIRDNGKIYMYHSMNSTNKETGRWYDTDVTKYKLNHDKCTFTYNIKSYEYNNKIHYNPKLVIYFTKEGFNKFIKML